MGLAASLVLVFSSNVFAYPTVKKHKPVAKMSLKEIERYQIKLINLDRWIIRTRRVHKTDVVWFSRQRIKWTSRELRQTKAELRKHAFSGGISHQAGWLCIHSGEGSWTSQTGNGYYGGLQMTYGWMGLVQNAALLSPQQQMSAAEEGFRRSGYSHAWLAGQWPNTYPPCTRYF